MRLRRHLFKVSYIMLLETKYHLIFLFCQQWFHLVKQHILCLIEQANIRLENILSINSAMTSVFIKLLKSRQQL